MPTMSELSAAGVTRMRLPSWNEHAYAQVTEGHTWVEVYDVLAGIGGGNPVHMTVADCDHYIDWEPLTHLVAEGGWNACDTAADFAGADMTGVTCPECWATTGP